MIYNTFQEFIDNFKSSTLTQLHIEKIKEFWNKIKQDFPLIDDPQTGLSNDGSYQFVWNKAEHHLDIDIYDDGSIDWFYRNSFSKKIDGTDESKDFLISEALIKYLNIITYSN